MIAIGIVAGGEAIKVFLGHLGNLLNLRVPTYLPTYFRE